MRVAGGDQRSPATDEGIIVAPHEDLSGGS